MATVRQDEAASTKSKANKTKRPAAADKAARASTTSALADRLRQRSDARAARSVDEDLLAPPSAIATVTELLTTSPSPTPAQPTPAAEAVPASELAAATAASATHGDAPEAAIPPEAAADPAVDLTSDAAASPAARTGPQRAPAAAGRSSVASEENLAMAREAVTKPIGGPDGRLQLRGERVAKMTLELPVPLVDALSRWERDETVATGQRVYRERLIDCALTLLPEDPDELVALARGLSETLHTADTEQVGTRVRESIARRLKNLRPELRVRRVRDVYLRHIYAAAIAQYLTALGVRVEDN